MLTTSEDTVRDARIYRVNAWREIKGRPALDFTAKVEAWLVSLPDDVEPGYFPGWWQVEMFGRDTRDSCSRKPWDWRAKRATHWLKPPDLAGEVRRALIRSKGIPGGGYAHPGFPPPTAAQYRRWAQGETRSSNMHYYDGAPVTLKPLAVKVKRTRKVATV
jgi:hypothetical protein